MSMKHVVIRNLRCSRRSTETPGSDNYALKKLEIAALSGTLRGLDCFKSLEKITLRFHANCKIPRSLLSKESLFDINLHELSSTFNGNSISLAAAGHSVCEKQCFSY